MKIYIDGKYYDKENAKIPVYDHGLLYGDGVFEGIRIYGWKIFRLTEHIERLYQSARAILLKIPLSKSDMEKTVGEAVEINAKKDGYIRLIVTRGVGSLGVDPIKCKTPSVIIIVDDIQLYPEEYYIKGISIITSSVRRISNDSLDPRVKSLNYLNNVLAKIEANNSGCQEAVMLNRDGLVTECTGDNIFIINQNRLITPEAVQGALKGITKDTVMEIAKKSGIETYEASISQYDLYNADECFLTGTGAEIIPVIQIDGRIIGDGKPGKITDRLRAKFKESLLP